jgi:hypothetical protein
MRLQASPPKSGLAEPEAAALPALGDNTAESLFDEGFQGCLLLVRQFARFGKEAVWYLYGCLHISSHTALYG